MFTVFCFCSSPETTETKEITGFMLVCYSARMITRGELIAFSK